MTLNQLRYLVAIVDAGMVISHAARHVHTTQSALSKQLKQIEAAMGQPLFQRRGYGLSGLTPCGSQVIAHARAVLAEMVGIQRLVARSGAESGRILRIATTSTQARYVLPAALDRLEREQRPLRVSLRIGTDAQVLGWAESASIDLALASTPGPRPRHVAAVPLYRWQRLALVPPQHPLGNLGRALTLADLAAYPLVSDASARDLASDFARALAPHDERVPLVSCSGDDDSIKAQVRAGLGVGIVAETAYQRSDDGDLVAVPAGGIFRSCTAWAAFPAQISPAGAALELVSALAPHMEIRALRRALALGEAVAWPPPPDWASVAARAGAQRAAG